MNDTIPNFTVIGWFKIKVFYLRKEFPDMGKEIRPAADRSSKQDAKKQALLAKQKEKRKGILIGVAVVLAIVLMAGVIVYKNVVDSGYLLRREVAVESENFTVDGAMMAYYFREIYGQYSSYASSLGINTSVSLKEQQSLLGSGTWFDYFMSLTKQNVSQTLALCEAAKAAGVELSEEELDEIDLYFEDMKLVAQLYGYSSFEQFLALNYGNGIKEKDLRKATEISELATKYSNQFAEALSYTTEECEEYYNENVDSFLSVDFLTYTVEVADFEETNELGEVTNAEAAKAAAEEEARKFAGATTVSEFRALVKAYLIDKLGETEESAEEMVEELLVEGVVKSNGNYDEAILDWAFAEDTAVGATTVSTAEETEFAAYFIVSAASRDETPLRNIRHILFSYDSYATEDEAKAAAEEAYAEWEAAGFSAEKFEELNDAKNDDTGSVDNGGLYEDVAPGEMVTEFDEWLFDSERAVGDHGLVESADYGWHIMNYVGESEMHVWQKDAETALSNEAYNAMIEANSGTIVFDESVLAHIAA